MLQKIASLVPEYTDFLKQLLGIGFLNLKIDQNGRGLYDQSHFKETGKCLERSLLQKNGHQAPGYFVHKT